MSIVKPGIYLTESIAGYSVTIVRNNQVETHATWAYRDSAEFAARALKGEGKFRDLPIIDELTSR